jgi:hypothetical protein
VLLNACLLAPAVQALADREQPTTSLAIAHLKSYQHMGQARVVCLEGCTCDPIEVDGHQEERNSQTHITMVEVSAAGVCVRVHMPCCRCRQFAGSWPTAFGVHGALAPCICFTATVMLTCAKPSSSKPQLLMPCTIATGFGMQMKPAAPPCWTHSQSALPPCPTLPVFPVQRPVVFVLLC